MAMPVTKCGHHCERPQTLTDPICRMSRARRARSRDARSERGLSIELNEGLDVPFDNGNATQIRRLHAETRRGPFISFQRADVGLSVRSGAARSAELRKLILNE